MVALVPGPHPDNCSVGSAPAGTQGAGAVRSLRADCLQAHPSPDPGSRSGRDIAAGLDPDSGPDFGPAPHCRVGESVHSAHRAAVLPDPSRLAGQASLSAGRFVAPTHPKPEPALKSRLALRKAPIANDFYSSTPSLTPKPRANRPIRPPGLLHRRWYAQSVTGDNPNGKQKLPGKLPGS